MQLKIVVVKMLVAFQNYCSVDSENGKECGPQKPFFKPLLLPKKERGVSKALPLLDLFYEFSCRRNCSAVLSTTDRTMFVKPGYTRLLIYCRGRPRNKFSSLICS